ncbi:3-oxosteroid 1-dehydrogenase [Aeromicrobium panaciterrae]|uniref:FAD-binding protein n=1 Tax=Aeromicrobium panaciterrae TaxID=363861 RepID=UPI0031D358AA
MAREANDRDIPADDLYDVVVVGSGAGGMVAALVARHHGMRVLVIEKADHFGGSSALSGGNVWIPNNPVNVRAGVEDSLDDARSYLNAIVGDSSSSVRREAFLRAGPEVIGFLEQHTHWVRFQRVPGYSDYQPEQPGGRPEGRSIEPVPVDARALKAEGAHLNREDVLTPPGGLWITTAEYRDLMLIARTWRGKRQAVRIAIRSWFGRLRGRRMLALGAAGTARLRLAMMDADIPLLLGTALKDLLVDNGKVVGVVCEREGEISQIRARSGVILASGGFEHNASMRDEYQEAPITTAWTSGASGNTGDGIRVAVEHGATTSHMDRAWWGPSVLTNDGAFFILSERGLPGSIMVNAAASRFVNESAPYVTAVDAMYDGHRSGVGHIPAYLIFDQTFRNRYAMIATPPRRRLPREWIDDGTVVMAPTLRELAKKLDLDPDALDATVERFNGFARSGNDVDFGRGESAYDRYYGDPTNSPNPNLGTLGKPPFYAFRVVPGDLGTNGGLDCDEHARVLRADGTAIDGLYATGNCTSAVMGRSYAGPGATIGPAMTFGFVAARHLASLDRTEKAKL